MNGNTLKLSLFLIGVLVSINIAVSGWALTNIVELREDMAGEKEKLSSHLRGHE